MALFAGNEFCVGVDVAVLTAKLLLHEEGGGGGGGGAAAVVNDQILGAIRLLEGSMTLLLGSGDIVAV